MPYQIAVFGPEFQPVAKSQPLTINAWRCGTPLIHGKEYLWQLTASVGGRKTLAPQPPEPEARFG
jgi:hypothetical protein